MAQLKLFMILLGCKPPGRHVEQHDFFFGIAASLNDLADEMQAFWPEAQGRIHIDGWREVNTVEGYQVKIVPKQEASSQSKKLFFINLGGYQPNRFEEQHYVILTAKDNSAAALKDAKSTLFFQNSNSSHVDDKYGIDVDDIYQIEDILSPGVKEQYQIELTPADNLVEDELHLGYLKMSLLK
ncbi:DUF1543 domain-containing protein [Mucilaginibacter jinjuensis]|uniref:DUF1543 domain-containing protein n=1 Tax=Mucilaginibacter jinjuensis TaxID=1176721 RepID=A0ABY7TF09_9SPHI|nr:DUF1543 domain-containing protein [Mucilaginibacter jinjuensis]WCT14788.1 DUF1543 domain-containing protein [Mucilaginibacter jinjuensis]